MSTAHETTGATEGKRALDCAIRALARRDHSEEELRRKLREKEYAAEIIGEVVAKLTRLGYLDDRRFARSWAESAIRNGRGYGPRLRLELNRRGVSAEIQQEVLEELGETYDESETLAALLARKFPGFAPGSATEKEKRRIVSYLQRRGFSLGRIFNQLRTIK